jgi:D-arabinose 1-dehydrogenase-like Zn-dependent alcohol dehydrogenase
MINNDWGVTRYPGIFGHEIVGIVAAVGANVSTHEVGSRVGCGPQRDNCGECRQCERGSQQTCPKIVKTYGLAQSGVTHKGGFGARVRFTSKWAFPIPAELASDVAVSKIRLTLGVF